MKKALLFILIAWSITTFAKDYTVKSPDGKIQVTVSVDQQITWSASVGNQQIFTNNTLSLDLGNAVLGVNPKVASAKTTSVNEELKPVVAVKSNKIINHYNQLTLAFKPDFNVSFRLFDNGIAYRFETKIKNEITVKYEEAGLNFSGDYGVLFPEEDSFYSHYERLYLDKKMSELTSGRFASLPALVKADNNIKIGITESDLFDYPCMFLEATGKNAFKSTFPKVILHSDPKGDRDIQNVKEADYIAKTSGTRNFPWRVFMISTEDARLVENQMVYLLGRETKLTIS